MQPTAELTTAATLAAKLRAFYASGPCDLSTAELAERFAAGRHAERQIQRAHELIRRTYGRRFVEIRQAYGRATLAVRRWIEPAADQLSRGVVADPLLISGDQTDQVDLRAKAEADRARARAPSRDPARVSISRRPARRLELPRTPLLEREPPIRLEAGVRAALRAAHGAGGLWAVERILLARRCRQRPTEALLAARTLAERPADVPGKVFWRLFDAACAGETLCDREKDRTATREAEGELLTGPRDAPRALLEQRRAELGERLAAVRLGGDTEHAAALEHAIRTLDGWLGGTSTPARAAPRPQPWPPPTPPPPPRPPPDGGARFLAALSPAVRAALERDTS